VVFSSEDGLWDDILSSMCAGMKERFEKQEEGQLDRGSFPIDYEGGKEVF